MQQNQNVDNQTDRHTDRQTDGQTSVSTLNLGHRDKDFKETHFVNVV